MFSYEAELRRVIDGDTIDLLVDLGFDTLRKIRVRLQGVNCPDHENPAGMAAATAFTTKWFKDNGPTFTIRTYREMVVGEEHDKTEKYGRYLADIFAQNAAGKSLNQDLVDAKMAVPYFGGARVSTKQPVTV